MRKKRFKHHKDLIKQAIKNIPVLTAEEQLLRNALRLKGVKNPSVEFLQKVIKKQKDDEIEKKYKELTEDKGEKDA